jgi:DNA-binding PadR family transcriptional regulator
MHGHCESHGGRWAAGRHRRGRFGGFGFGGRHGGGMNPDDMRAGRMLAQGDLRLIALSFIAQEPRHGYEIIKLVEEKTADWYSPSPGIVYPTLTYLEEAGYVTASTEGAKKLYAITGEGRAYLESNRDVVDAVLDRLTAASAATAATSLPSSKPRSIICARPSASALKAMPKPKRGWSKSSPAPRPSCSSAVETRRETMKPAPPPACAHARDEYRRQAIAPECAAEREKFQTA